MKKLIVALILSMFLISFASALEINPFADSKSFTTELKQDTSSFLVEDFNSKYGIVTINSNFMWVESGKVAEYSLTSNTEVCLIDCEAHGKAILYTDGLLFEDTLFKDDSGKDVAISFKYYIKGTESYEVNTPEYKEVCGTVTNKNGTYNKCTSELSGVKTETKTREIWNEYKGEELKAGDYEWKLIGKKPLDVSVDFIPIKSSKELSEWAWWVADWGNYKEVKVQESSGNDWVNYSVLLTVPYADGMNADFSDLRFSDSSLLKELPYYVEFKTDSTSASVWVKTDLTKNVNTSVYMFYNNTLAATKSNRTTAFIFDDDAVKDRTGEYSYMGGGGTFAWGSGAYQYERAPTDNTGVVYPTVMGTALGNYSIEATLKDSSVSWYVSGISARQQTITYPNNNQYRIQKANGDLVAYADSSSQGNVGTANNNAYYNASIWVFGNTINYTGKGVTNGNVQITNTNYSSGSAGIWNYGSDGDGTYFKYLRIRMYSNPEPTYNIGVANINNGSVSKLSSTVINVTITNTINNKNITYSPIIFNGSITAGYDSFYNLSDDTYFNSSYTLTNYTLNIWNSTGLFYNSTSTITGSQYNFSNSVAFTSIDSYNWNVYACDGGNCSYAPSNNTFSFGYNFNYVNYTTPVVESSLNYITASFTTPLIPTTITLNYSGVLSYPVVQVSGNDYLFNSSVIAPSVTTNTNISFSYIISYGSQNITSNIYTQLVNNIDISNDCTTNIYPVINISNFDEILLTQVNGTVEYTINLNSNNIQIALFNGTASGTEMQLCSNNNLTSSGTGLNLQLRYYRTDLLSNYRTYNIVNNQITTQPYFINLYYLNLSQGNIFKINYEDFYYIKHPGALIQVQRQYLSDNTYKIVELPIIPSQGSAQATLDSQNVRYKFVIVENGVVIDTFNNIFPMCQNIVLGQCELNLRGFKTSSTTVGSDLTYALTTFNGSITFTYVIPSGTPKLVTFSTNQNSAFLSNISVCSTSLFASGGTIICTYNSTVGDSLVSTQVDVNGVPTLFGTIKISEDLSSFFLLNNYFIAFIIMLSLSLMFVSSGVILVFVAIFGLMFMGMIFLLKGIGVGTIAGSLGWIIVAGAIIAYKISNKEEKT
jgi:hypothetical protein